MSMEKIKSISLDVLTDVIGGFLIALGVYNFAAASDFPITGISGIALVFYHYLKWPIGTVSLILNIPIIVICGKMLGVRFLLCSLKTIVISTLVMDFVAPLFPMYQGDILLSCICRGILGGIGYALIYMRNTSTGGTDFIMMAIRAKKPHLTLGRISMVIDCTILVLNGILMQGNIDKLIYGLMGSVIACVVIDKVMYGADAGKVTLIVTVQGQRIADKIYELTERGATLLHGSGSYSGEDKQVVMCACNYKQMHMVQKAVKEVDKHAFFCYDGCE